MKRFEKHMVALHGDKARAWISELPARIEAIAREWKLTDVHPVFNLSYSYVMMAMFNNIPVIIKFVLMPSELEREVAALRVFNGSAIMPLLHHTHDVMMIERALPGKSLRKYFPTHENASVHIFTDIITKLHKASYEFSFTETYRKYFTPLSKILNILDRDESRIPISYLLKARELRTYLLDTTQEDIILHGDLHQDNILSHQNSFRAINPKGYIGDRWYDMGAFVRNPLGELTVLSDALDIMKRRIEMIARHMQGDPVRLTQWSFVQSVLTWLWSLEDGACTSPLQKQTELLYPLVA